MKNTVKLNTIDNAMDFVKYATLIDGDVTVYSGRYVVNGKSIMGLMSLDLTAPVIVEYPLEESKIFNEFILTIEV